MTPCCDLCVHVRHHIEWTGEISIKGDPIGCKKHKDEKHRLIAAGNGVCEDFKEAPMEGRKKDETR